MDLGPDSALAERQQCFRRFGDFGFCLEALTSVKGVIASDCFHVLDKWLVEPTGETSVALTVKHQVQFTKRTLLKRVIQNTSNTEAHKWYKGYANMLESSFQDKEPDEETDKDELKQHNKTKDTIAGEQEISMSSWYWSFEVFSILMWSMPNDWYCVPTIANAKQDCLAREPSLNASGRKCTGVCST